MHGVGDIRVAGGTAAAATAPAALHDIQAAGPDSRGAPELRERLPPTASCPTLWTAAAGSRAGLPPQAAAAVAETAGAPVIMELPAVVGSAADAVGVVMSCMATACLHICGTEVWQG
jgi:hypothetical protein